MLNPTCNPNKPGVVRLNQVGSFAVIANKQLHDNGKCRKFAVVNTRENWLDSTHTNYDAALSYAKKLS